MLIQVDSMPGFLLCAHSPEQYARLFAIVDWNFLRDYYNSIGLGTVLLGDYNVTFLWAPYQTQFDMRE